ncbi:MAG: leucine-rich repeat domain-containing protein [Oscillospiraceae bacterium]|nr:leucine-rich repeat domain-containing protein [Oscillospiraceae bacterium]
MNKRKGLHALLISAAAAAVCLMQCAPVSAETTTVPAETTTAPAAESTTAPTEAAATVTEPETTSATEPEITTTEAVTTTLHEVNISDPLTRIKYEALPDGSLCLTEYRWESDELTVTIPEQIDGKTVTKIGERAFLYCYADTVILPASVREIDERAFVNCTFLQRMDIPEGCVRIGEEAFSGCERLSTVLLGANVREIGKNAFAGTPFLNGQTGDMVIVGDGILLQYRGSSAAPEIPSSVKTIAAYAFADHTEVKILKLPSSVRRVQDAAFSGCTGLSEITLSDTLDELAGDALIDTAWYKNAKGDYVTLGDHLVTFRGKKTVAEVPDGVRVISESAFAGNAVITTVKLTDSVEEIRADAFQDCTSLQVATLGDHIRSIESGAFSGCKTLKYIRLGHSLETLGAECFLGCPFLTEIYLPDTLTQIGAYALGYAKNDSGGKYDKLRNELVIYANAEAAVQYADTAGISREPLPDTENTEPAPEVTTLKGHGETGHPSGSAWIPAAVLGGLLVCAGLVVRGRKQKKTS